MGAMYCIEVGFFFAMTLLMGLIGVHSLAANQVTMQYLGPLMGTIFCIAKSMTVRMRHQLGAKQAISAERAAYDCCIFSDFRSDQNSFVWCIEGLKDTRFTLLTSIISFWCIAFPAGYVLSIHLKLSGIGFW